MITTSREEVVAQIRKMADEIEQDRGIQIFEVSFACEQSSNRGGVKKLEHRLVVSYEKIS